MLVDALMGIDMTKLIFDECEMLAWIECSAADPTDHAVKKTHTTTLDNTLPRLADPMPFEITAENRHLIACYGGYSDNSTSLRHFRPV